MSITIPVPDEGRNGIRVFNKAQLKEMFYYNYDDMLIDEGFPLNKAEYIILSDMYGYALSRISPTDNTVIIDLLLREDDESWRLYNGFEIHNAYWITDMVELCTFTHCWLEKNTYNNRWGYVFR